MHSSEDLKTPNHSLKLSSLLFVIYLVFTVGFIYGGTFFRWFYLAALPSGLLLVSFGRMMVNSLNIYAAWRTWLFSGIMNIFLLLTIFCLETDELRRGIINGFRDGNEAIPVLIVIFLFTGVLSYSGFRNVEKVMKPGKA